MNIRSFSPSDSMSVRNMVLDVLADEGFQYDPAKDHDLDNIEGFYLKNGGAFFVAVDDGVVIGSSAVRRVSHDTCDIKRIYVRKSHRGKGIGFELFSKALEFAKQNYYLVTLKTDASLDVAICMYLKNGFVLVKVDQHTLYFEKQMI
jgi:putative acetyltransferase